MVYRQDFEAENGSSQPVRTDSNAKLVSPPSDVAIDVINLSKVYKLYSNPKDRLKEALHPLRRKYHTDFYALKDVTFQVRKGDIIGIIGRNGSGKSTLLKVIAGLLQPASGSVKVNGGISALLELGAGFNPDLTGLENIYFYGTVMGLSKEEMEERIDGILAFADIGEFINQPIRIYSSGMRARLAFAVATEINPDILIVDEVLAVGDAVFQRKCYARIENMFKDEKTVILVSHQKNSIVGLCHNAILLDQGILLTEGKAGEVVKEYEKLCNSKFLADAAKRNELTKIINADENRNESLGNYDNGEVVFDYSLVEKNVEYFKKSEVTFESFGLYNEKGQKVNILKAGNTYTVKANLVFEETLKDIIFALRIKNLQGLVMAWTGYPLNRDSFMSFAKGDRLDIDLEFDCNLFEGVYSIDAGLQSFEKTEIYVHIGIRNIYMFEVKRKPRLNYFGAVYLNFRNPMNMRELW